MFLRFEENPNTGFVDDRIFQERSEPRVVTHVLRRRSGQDLWCPITGLKEKGTPVPALARKVEDSGEGICYLVYGGLWGLRLTEPGSRTADRRPQTEIHWSLEDPHQWGEPFLLLPADGADLRFNAV